MDTVRPALSPERVCVWEIQMHAAQGDRDVAFAGFGALISRKELSPGSLEESTRWLDRLDENRVNRLLQLKAGDPDVNPLVAEYLMDRFCAGGAWMSGRRWLEELPVESEAWSCAVRVFLERAGEQKQTTVVHETIGRFRPSLHDNTELWGSVTYALTGVDDFAGCMYWARDWPNRPAAPWMLNNIALSYRTYGWDQEAARVSAKALQLPEDHTRMLHESWLLFDDYRTGNISACHERLGRIDRTDLRSVQGLIVSLVEAALRVEGSMNPKQAVTDARKTISAILADPRRSRRSQLERRMIRRVIYQFACRARRLSLWIWAVDQIFQTL